MVDARYIEAHIQEDLGRKMVFLGGPRQCGKTTLVQRILDTYPSHAYFNWDNTQHRRAILAEQWTADTVALGFDELHKYPRWKNWIKGIYDVSKTQHRILVTGSARLDVYRRGGDSLLGRYHYWRLHPFSLHEHPRGMSQQEALTRLMTLGGFPEPFLDGSERFARRWRSDRFDRVLKDDIRDLEPLRDLQTLGLFVDALRSRVGGAVVLSNIAQELSVSPNTLKHWLEVLERMYIVFVVRPLTRKLPRAVQKPPKVYFFDNADVDGDEGAKFENLVATHLLKQLQFFEDRDGFRYELSYVRDKDGREVDFAISRDKKLIALVEAKWSDPRPSTALSYFSEKLGPDKATLVVGNIKRPYDLGKLSVRGAGEMFHLRTFEEPAP